MINLEPHLEELLAVVAKADQAVLEVYNSLDIHVETKEDNTPITQADIFAHQILMAGIKRLTPGIPVVSEEGDQQENRRIVRGKNFWLVDPIDGTREFIARTGDFTICLARIEDGIPRFGIVSAPALGVTYYGGPGLSSYKRERNVSGAVQIGSSSNTHAVVLTSRSHLDPSTAAYIKEHYPDHSVRGVGSQLKFTELAEGRADVYPRLESPLHHWDVAAGHAILAGVGGRVTRIDGSPIDYHAESLGVPDFIARAA